MTTKKQYKPGQLITINKRLYRIKARPQKTLNDWDRRTICQSEAVDCRQVCQSMCAIMQNDIFMYEMCSRTACEMGHGMYLEFVSK